MYTNIKQILIVVSNLSVEYGGGVATSVINYYRALEKNESVDVTVVATILPNETDFIDSFIINNKKFILFKTNGRQWRYSKDLNQFLKNEIQKYDLVWVHGTWLSQSYFVSKYAIKYSIPYIVTPHGSLHPYAIKQKKLKKYIYWYCIEKNVFKNAAAIHCLTDFEEKSVHKISNTRTFVLPNTIGTGIFQSKVYAEMNHICFIGRFHHKKGLDLLLEAFSSIERINLLIAGDGENEYTKYIYSLVEKYDIKEKVSFLGFADEKMKKEIFQKSLFCVIPSYSEGMAMVGLESISSATPVLITKQCDFEIISGWNGGIVIENNQPEVIREGIKKMISEDIVQMSKNAHHLAKEHFDLKVVGKHLLEQFKMISK